MLERIVSGGQTGVDRAALDVALVRNIPCGGWCPLGRLAEDRVIAATYPLKETPTADYAERTAWNVRDSDGTLIISWGVPTEGTAFTAECARGQGKPFYIWDLDADRGVDGPRAWICDNLIRTLNVAGPRESKHTGAYVAARDALDRLLSDLTNHES